MDDSIACPNCGGPAYPIGPAVSSREYLCSRCATRFNVRVHYVDALQNFRSSALKALVDVTDESGILKLSIKAKKVFRGFVNFRYSDLDKQIAMGLKVWDLGYYSETEVSKLRSIASQVGLEVRFVSEQQ